MLMSIPKDWHPRIILPILGWSMLLVALLAIGIPAALLLLRGLVHFLIY
jgi:hypothetical protein